MSVKDANAGTLPDTVSDPSDVRTGLIDDNELKQIVDVATSYLETGLFDDADDILQEVLEAGAVSPEIEDLIRRIEEARLHHGVSAAAPVDDTVATPAPRRRLSLVHLTAPLPGVDRLPRNIQRIVVEAERDFNEGRKESALDLCHVVTASAPDFIPNYLRMAEVRIALGDERGARSLVASVERFYDIEGDPDDQMLHSIYLALNPDDTESLVQHARNLLAEPNATVLEPYVPAAIDATMDTEPRVSRELARLYVERRPTDDAAIRMYIRSAVAVGDATEIYDALKRFVHEDMVAVDLLWWRGALSATRKDPEWIHWLARVVEQVRLNQENYGAVRSAIDRSESFMPPHVRYLGGAVLSTAAGQWDMAQAEIEDWMQSVPDPIQPVDAFLADCVRVEVIEVLGLPEIVPALESLLIASVRVDTSEIPIDDLFAIDVSSEVVLTRYRAAVLSDGSVDAGIAFLGSLLNAGHSDYLVRQTYAELLLEVGRRNEGIRELRSLAQSHEQSGNLSAMAGAMRMISEAVPDSIEIKEMLVGVYLRRGILDEALYELEAIAQLRHEVSDTDGAIEAYSKAAEIACAMGNFALGNDLYDRGVATDPNNVPVRHAAVAFYLQTGSVNRAAEHLREIVRIALLEGDPDEAVAALHQIIGLAPDDLSSYHKLGEVLTAMGEYKQAERVYRRLSDLAPDDPVLHAKQSALAVLAATS